MAIFPVPNASDTQDLLRITQYANDVASGGILFPMIMLAIWVISFIGSLANGSRASVAWIFACFIYVFLGTFLALVNLLNPTYVYFAIFLLAVGVVWDYLSNQRE